MLIGPIHFQFNFEHGLRRRLCHWHPWKRHRRAEWKNNGRIINNNCIKIWMGPQRARALSFHIYSYSDLFFISFRINLLWCWPPPPHRTTMLTVCLRVRIFVCVEFLYLPAKLPQKWNVKNKHLMVSSITKQAAEPSKRRVGIFVLLNFVF